MAPDTKTPAALLRGHKLAASGNHAEAGAAYAKLAAQSEKDMNQRRAGNIHTLASLAYVEAADDLKALDHARKALKHFITLELYFRAPSFYMTLLKRAEAKKLTRLIDTMRTEFSSKMVIYTGESRKETLPRSQLPATCPGCALPMRPDEVDWISPARAECDYCGTVVDAR